MFNAPTLYVCCSVTIFAGSGAIAMTAAIIMILSRVGTTNFSTWMSTEIYDRQMRALGTNFNTTLQNLSVCVIGRGILFDEIRKHLVLLGIKTLYSNEQVGKYFSRTSIVCTAEQPHDKIDVGIYDWSVKSLWPAKQSIYIMQTPGTIRISKERTQSCNECGEEA